MDLLGGYGSGSDDEQSDGTAQTSASAPEALKQPWAKLPTPSAATKRIVAFQLPLNRSMLKEEANSDDEKEAEERAAKRAKIAASKLKSKLMDFLPPPKNDAVLGAGAWACFSTA